MTEQQAKPFDREKYIKSFLEEAINVKLMLESAKDTMDSIKETASEKLEIPKGEIGKLIESRFKQIHSPEKYNKEKVMIETKYEILTGMENK